MKKNKRTVKKSIRDEIMTEIALQYRENQKSKQKPQKVNIFSIWTKHDMSYYDFLNVILSLEAQGYLRYEKAKDNAEKFRIKGEYIPQEFVALEPSGKSFSEDLLDEKDNEIKTNLKRPLLVQVLSAIILLTLSGTSLGLLWKIIKWFLSLFRS